MTVYLYRCEVCGGARVENTTAEHPPTALPCTWCTTGTARRDVGWRGDRPPA